MDLRPVLSPSGLNRRAVMARSAALSAALVLGGLNRATAQDATSVSMTGHPMVGTWLSGTGPNDIQLVHWDADGNMAFQWSTAPTTATDGTITYNDTAMGVWEPDGARRIHITFTWATRDATGAVIGTTTVDAYPEAREDGQSFVDEGTKVVLTLRDPAGNVSQVIHGVPPVHGVRVTPGKPGYEEVLAMIAAQPTATPAVGTPAG